MSFTLKNSLAVSSYNYFYYYRLRFPITADSGKHFASVKFKNHCKENDFKLYNTIPYWPQQIDKVERHTIVSEI